MRAALAALLAAVVGAVCVVALACVGAPPKPAVAPSAHAGQDPRAAIEALDREIASDLRRANVPPPLAATCSGAGCAAAMSEPFATPTSTDLQCHPATTDRCNDACTLSTSICRNQEKICDLAKQLAGDDWAANKCEGARASCKAAHETCCSCLP